jgi:hypothetical protein
MKYFVIGIFAIVVWNLLIIQRDKQMFKAYDSCTQTTYYPNCLKNNK